jgi:hypothetical protein
MKSVFSILFCLATLLVLLLSCAINNVCADSPDLSNIVPAILDLDLVRTRINRQFKDLRTADGEGDSTVAMSLVDALQRWADALEAQVLAFLKS